MGVEGVSCSLHVEKVFNTELSPGAEKEGVGGMLLQSGSGENSSVEVPTTMSSLLPTSGPVRLCVCKQVNPVRLRAPASN